MTVEVSGSVAIASRSRLIDRHHMPSSVAHALTAVALGRAVYPSERNRLSWVAVAGAVLLDLDAVGRPFGWGDVQWLGGHRALTHSLPFAAALGLAAIGVACSASEWRERRLGAWAFFAVVFALHGVLDAFTTYGQGVMFFAPFDETRYQSPWRPIRGVFPEIAGIWLPALAFIWWRGRRAR
jgi:inner membrane protein